MASAATRETVDDATHIPTLSQHPTIQAHRRQREDLVQKLTTAREDQARLLADRVGIATPPPLDEVHARIRSLEQAISAHDVIARRARALVQAEIRARVKTRARELVAEMVPLVDRIEVLNAELARLHELDGGDSDIPPTFRPALFSPGAWLAAARAFVSRGAR